LFGRSYTQRCPEVPHAVVSSCLAEQQAQQSQALKMFSALLGQQGGGQGQGHGAAEQSAAAAAAGGASSLEVSPGIVTMMCEDHWARALLHQCVL
jgi:hypothetical protein